MSVERVTDAALAFFIALALLGLMAGSLAEDLVDAPRVEDRR